MKYGLSEEQLAEIIAFIKGYPEVEEAILFGSRAIDTYKEASDIDIAIKGEKVTAGLAATIKFDLEEDTFLPFFFDVLAYPSLTNRALIEHIDNKGVRLFGGDVGGGWVEYKLGDVLEIKYGKDHKKLNDGIIPVYGSGGIMRYADTALYDEESILIPRKGTLNNIFYLNKPFWTVDTLFYTKPNKSLVNIKFLYYQLSEIDFNALNVGSAVPSLTVSVLNDVLLYLPELQEQKAIANVLSSLDDKIDLLHRQNKTLEAMAETLFRQWFIEEAKEDWEDGVISDLIEFNPSRKLIKGIMAPYLDMASLSTTSFNPVGWYEREFSSGTKFMNGDTLLARITPCLENGKTAYITIFEDNQIGWGSTEYIVMRSKNNLHSFFSYILARNDDFRDFAEGCMVGSSGRQRVEINHLMSYQIKRPSEDIIQKFNAVADSIVPKLHNNSLQIQTLEKLRDNLLPKLMSGEVRVAYDQQEAA